MLAASGPSFFNDRKAAQIARDAVEIIETTSAADVESLVSAASQTPVAQTPGITPIVVANRDFYRIDTATLVPRVDPADWKLKIRGMVDNELDFTYDELLARANWVVPVTLSCVSNEVGGGLVGNAVWHGVPLTELLDEAGVQSGATQLSSRSVDGWDCGFPTELAYDGRTAMVAVAMNGEPLPLDHGFPARLVVSGLYGYVSATKWLDTIELTTIEAFNGFWISRGWSKDGPVKTQSRIDTPRNGTAVDPGVARAIAGVAWAPNTGIQHVEVQIDNGDWVMAELGESLSDDTWVQWKLAWTPDAGNHTIKVRATDKSGFTQSPDPVYVAPNGAEGWHTISVRS
ncbi:MAG: molybdopterin-dependent oxidoreductase [Acidimicrobiales bacterium]